MVDRKSHGDPINQLSARTWNSFIDAAEDFKRRKTSTPIRPTSNQRRTDIIDVRNDSPFTRAKGEVLELNGDFLLDRVEKDYLWFSGVAVTGSGNNFCVLEQPAAAGDIRPAQVSGVCVAQINITSTSHNHAAPSSGSTVLVSGTVGPAKILHQPALTGEQTCVVLLGSAMAGELIWFRVESTGSNRLDPGGSATAFRQEWATSVYQTPSGSPSAETIYDISDASAFFGQNFVLPGELVPCMQSSVSGRLECVGSRGLRREGIVTETGGIVIGGNGEVTVRLDESVGAGWTLDPVYWNWIDEEDIDEDSEVIVEFWPDRGQWVIVDRTCPVD